jgi:nucleoside-diphosphate-sugar epimerase
MIERYPNDYLVTGAMGWCGKRLVRLLTTGFDAPRLAGMPSPRRIRCVILPGQDARELISMSPMVEVVEGDVRKPEDCIRMVAGMKGATLIHTAGIIHPARVSDFFDINHNGTLSLVRAAAEAGFQKAVVVSSNSPIGNNPHHDHQFDEESPYNPYMGYGRSKMSMELGLAEIHASGRIPVTIVRPPWFYGPDQPPRQTLFFTMIKEGKGPIIGGGENRRSMAYVDNLAQGLILCAAVEQAAGKTYWIADARPYSMNEILDTIERIMEREFKITVTHKRMRLPGLVADFAGVVDASIQKLGFYHQKIHVLSEMNKTIACDISKAKKELGYEPTHDLESGMRESIRWCLANGHKI